MSAICAEIASGTFYWIEITWPNHRPEDIRSQAGKWTFVLHYLWFCLSLFVRLSLWLSQSLWFLSVSQLGNRLFRLFQKPFIWKLFCSYVNFTSLCMWIIKTNFHLLIPSGDWELVPGLARPRLLRRSQWKLLFSWEEEVQGWSNDTMWFSFFFITFYVGGSCGFRVAGWDTAHNCITASVCKLTPHNCKCVSNIRLYNI